MSKAGPFKLFVGIDQTGAITPAGKPRPLNVTLIDSRQKLEVFPKLKLKKLTLPHLSELLQTHFKRFNNEKVLICVDSVLGLPQELKLKPRSVLEKIKTYSFEGKEYGAVTAHSFFNHFLNDNPAPRRKVEIQVNANSVFNLKPFQKNIGCGSYRVLRDLAEDPSWFCLWPFETKDTQYVIAEGYPSFFWKSLLGVKNRNLDLINKKFKSHKFINLDQADSFMLALGALKSQEQITQFKRSKRSNFEGWILGVPHE